MNEKIVSIEHEIFNLKMLRPHVVILGAGASKATCIYGDKNGNILPLMNDLTETLGLTKLLTDWNIDPNQNFEKIFSDLYKQDKIVEIKELEAIIENYFRQLELPDHPTIYDHLVLSLCEIDVIATFNWDPLLLLAYARNNRKGLKLPQLLFLHGCVSIGYCKIHGMKGSIGRRCQEKCSEIYQSSPLLYPIQEKNYASNQFIFNEWKLFKIYLERAFMVTIFGYSGPKSDQEAIDAMKKAWREDIDQRNLKQAAFISHQTEQEISENWKQFIYADHWEFNHDFYSSWIANHPRRTGEAYINQYIDAKYIHDNPIPRDLDFPELWTWYMHFQEAEEIFCKKKECSTISSKEFWEHRFD